MDDRDWMPKSYLWMMHKETSPDMSKVPLKQKIIIYELTAIISAVVLWLTFPWERFYG